MLLAAALTAPLLAACGAGSGGSTVRWFVGQEESGAYERAARACGDASGGRYSIRLEPLPTTADLQRALLVRRLAARDPGIDLMGMDVIWTAEFAAAGWIRPWEGPRAAEVSRDVLVGPLITARYQDRLWAAPFTSNTQLLWYRRSLVPRPPATWDAMIDLAEALPEGRNHIAVQGGRFEGYATWMQALLASAGTELVRDADRPDRAAPGLADGPTQRALSVVRRLADSAVADPALAVSTERTTGEQFEAGTAAFALAYPPIYPGTRRQAPDVFADTAWARYPAVVAGRPARPPLGGVNLGVSAYSRHPELAFDAATCLRSAANQKLAATAGGLPPTLSAVYDAPEVRRQFPFGDLLRAELADAAPRPATPAYRDVSLAVQQVLHPPGGIDPAVAAPRLRRAVAAALASESLL
jgi:trehalose/maltose transport system substrate-binding protein